MNHDREDRIRKRAYALWEQAGRPEGEETAHWAQAEHEIEKGDGEIGGNVRV